MATLPTVRQPWCRVTQTDSLERDPEARNGRGVPGCGPRPERAVTTKSPLTVRCAKRNATTLGLARTGRPSTGNCRRASAPINSPRTVAKSVAVDHHGFKHQGHGEDRQRCRKDGEE